MSDLENDLYYKEKYLKYKKKYLLLKNGEIEGGIDWKNPLKKEKTNTVKNIGEYDFASVRDLLAIENNVNSLNINECSKKYNKLIEKLNNDKNQCKKECTEFVCKTGETKNDEVACEQVKTHIQKHIPDEWGNMCNNWKIQSCSTFLINYKELVGFIRIIKHLKNNIDLIIKDKNLEKLKNNVYYNNTLRDQTENTRKIKNIVKNTLIKDILPLIKEKVNKLMILLEQCNKGKCDKFYYTDAYNEMDIYLSLLYDEIQNFLDIDRKLNSIWK